MAIFCMFYVGLFKVYGVHFEMYLVWPNPSLEMRRYWNLPRRENNNAYLPDHLNPILFMFILLFLTGNVMMYR